MPLPDLAPLCRTKGLSLLTREGNNLPRVTERVPGGCGARTCWALGDVSASYRHHAAGGLGGGGVPGRLLQGTASPRALLASLTKAPSPDSLPLQGPGLEWESGASPPSGSGPGAFLATALDPESRLESEVSLELAFPVRLSPSGKWRGGPRVLSPCSGQWARLLVLREEERRVLRGHPAPCGDASRVLRFLTSS